MQNAEFISSQKHKLLVIAASELRAVNLFIIYEFISSQKCMLLRITAGIVNVVF